MTDLALEDTSDVTSSQEDYAEKFGKDKSIQTDSIKRKERIKNIDVELENWRNLKSNSRKMISELTDRKNKMMDKTSSLLGELKSNSLWDTIQEEELLPSKWIWNNYNKYL